MKKRISFISAALVLLGAEPVLAKNVYSLLKDTRSEITVPEYNEYQKQTVLTQARLVLDEIFPHKEIKAKSFGEKTNWTPKLNNIQKKLTNLSDEQFHWEMSKVFLGLQDLHTSYHYPKPHSCYASFIPISVKPVEIAGEIQSIITNLNERADILKLVGDYGGIEIGAKILSVNGTPMKDVIEEVKSFSPGANPDAIETRAHGYFTFRSHRSLPVVSEDEVVLEVENPNGEIITKTLPWIARKKTECLKTDKSNTGEIGDLEFVNEQLEVFLKEPSPIKSLLSREANEWISTNERYLKYKIIEVDRRKVGVLKLMSFKPVDLKWKDTLKYIGYLLRSKLNHTESLIIDLRDNGGGYIALAEGMMQLLTSTRTTPSIFRLRNTNVNLEYFRSITWDNNFFQLLAKSAGNGNDLTTAIPFDWEYNYLQQSYFKPFGLLTNANCYSSCDMFSAIVQDHESGMVFGEDSTTGAGGANNVDYNRFMNRFMNPSGVGLKSLPGGQNFGFSFRQYIRQGKNNGEILEDLGVISDTKIPRSIEDIISDSSSQYELIGRQLLDI